MKRNLLLGYQLLTGLSDTATGLLLVVAPAFTLHLMKLHVATDCLPYLSYLGVFVFSVGLACLYGALLVHRPKGADKLEVVWLLTALTRGLVAIFVIEKVVSDTLEPGWLTVAATDGLFAAVQFFGLMRGWLHDVRN
jgi:hypothetical protein